MEANEMLIKCLKCKHNIECFGIDVEEETHKGNPDDIKISVDAICKNLTRLNPKTISDFAAYAILMYVRTTNVEIDKGAENRVLSTLMCVLEGLTGSNKLRWNCPDAFEYSPIIDCDE